MEEEPKLGSTLNFDDEALNTGKQPIANYSGISKNVKHITIYNMLILRKDRESLQAGAFRFHTLLAKRTKRNIYL